MNETVSMPEPQTDQWLRDLKEAFNECETFQELLLASSLLWYYRYCEDVWKFAVPLYRARLRELNVAHHKVVAVDFNNMFWPAFSMGNSVLPMLRKLFVETQPDVFIVAVDSRVKVDRYDYEGYKAGGSEHPEGFDEAFDEALRKLSESGVQVVEIDGLESDDILSTIAFRCYVSEVECVLVSNDKDMWQCLNKGVVIYDYKKKEYRNSDWLKATHRITPRQVTDWLSLTGKDGIKSAEGVGPDTASKWLEAYGSYIGILDHADKLTPAKRKAAKDFYPHYFTSKNMHTLSRTASVIWQVT